MGSGDKSLIGWSWKSIRSDQRRQWSELPGIKPHIYKPGFNFVSPFLAALAALHIPTVFLTHWLPLYNFDTKSEYLDYRPYFMTCRDQPQDRPHGWPHDLFKTDPMTNPMTDPITDLRQTPWSTSWLSSWLIKILMSVQFRTLAMFIFQLSFTQEIGVGGTQAPLSMQIFSSEPWRLYPEMQR